MNLNPSAGILQGFFLSIESKKTIHYSRETVPLNTVQYYLCLHSRARTHNLHDYLPEIQTDLALSKETYIVSFLDQKRDQKIA